MTGFVIEEFAAGRDPNAYDENLESGATNCCVLKPDRNFRARGRR